jgi:hypothetical protein
MQVGFSGHETFPFRYGWLKKGVDAVAQDSAFFSNERAMIGLGVGKNMVSSIKHWCLATGLLDAERAVGTTRMEYAPSEIGCALVSDDGFDPFLEDTATLWLVHWRLASNRAHSTTWFWLFNHWHSVEFSKEQIFGEMQKWLEQNQIKEISEKLLRRDIDCCLRTYVHSRQKINSAVTAEETFDCPLVELNLITELADGKTYQFRRGEQKTLPDEILLFALTEFWGGNQTGGNSISLEKLAFDAGSPGRIFKLDTDSLVQRLDRIGKKSDGAFSYRESAGIKQVFRHKEIKPLDWLKKYYGTNSTDESI